MPPGGKVQGKAPAPPPQSDLAAQLQQLAVTQGVNQGRRHPGKASLLYTFQEAADIEADAIHRIGVEGLDQLCALDGRFQAYRRTLFGQASAALDRDASTAGVNAKLDAAIAGFCTLLSSYFLISPSFKALEWLVRKYKVHERNVDDLMGAALPYHETEQFVRLAQILRLDPRSKWAFLEPMQSSGAPAPREALVLRCTTDRSLLRFVCDLAQRQADPRVAGRVALPFYAVLLCEFLAKQKSVDEQLLTMLLPYLLAGLGPGVVPDYRAATYMVVGQLASRATFSADLAEALATEVCRTASPALLGSAAMLLAHLANTQEHFEELPERAFKQLAKVAGLVEHLAALSDKGCRIQPLLCLLARAAAAQLPSHPHYEQLLQGLLARVEMGSAARPLADAVLAQAAAAAEAEGEAADARLPAMQRLLRTLDLRCPEALDAAVNAALPAGSQAVKGEVGEAAAAAAQRVLAALNAAFEGTARCPLLEAGTTVMLAAEAPAAAMRLLAVQRLDTLAASSPGTEAAAAAGAALLRRLQDDSPAVVQAVLSAASLLQLPSGPLLEGLASCFDRALSQAGDRGAKKAARAESRGVARKVLKLLSGPLLASEPQAPPRALLLVLASLLVGPACGRKVAASALKAARALEAPLLAGLRGLAATAEAAEEAAGRQPKARKGGKKGDKAAEAGAAAADASKAAADAAYNGSVVAALAGAAGGSAAAAEQLAQLLAAVSGSSEPSGARAEVLLLLAAHAAVQSGGEGSGAVAAALLRALQPDGGAIGAAFQPAAVLPHESFGEGGLPSASLLQRSVDGHLGPASLHATAVLGALRCAPWPSLAPRDAKDALPLLRTLCSLRWQPGLAALLARVAEQQGDAPLLLSELFAAPPEAEAAGVAEVAAAQAASLLEGRLAAARGGKKAASNGGASVALLCRTLCALCHPNEGVRAAAVDCATAAAKLAAPALPDRTCKALASTLAEQAATLAADSEAAPRLLEVLLGAGDDPPEALAGYVLAQPDAEALGGALLAAAEEEAGGAAAAGGRAVGAAATAAHTARLLLEFCGDWAAPEALLSTCQKLLGSGARMRAAPAGTPAAQQKEALQVAAAARFTAANLEELLQEGSCAAPLGVLEAWCALLDPSSPTPAARLAALTHVVPRCFEALPAEVQGRALKALLRAASKDGDEACRGAALAALAALPLAADALLPLLPLAPADVEAGPATPAVDAVMAEAAPSDEDDEELTRLKAAAADAEAQLASPRAKQRGRGKAGKEAEAAAKAAAEAVARRRQQLADARAARQQGRRGAQRGGGASVAESSARAAAEGCVAVLELLQWKDNVAGRLSLVPAVQGVLAQLLAALEGGSAADEAGLAASLPTAELVYLVQLCLAALTSVARAELQPATAAAPASVQPTPGKGKGKGRTAAAAGQAGAPLEGAQAFDLGLAARAAQAAPDGAVRNAALELVAELAQGMPEAALQHVLEVVAVVGASAALQQDEQSERVATAALRAILPAWTAAGHSLQELAAAVVAALPRVSPHRRLPLVLALTAALPEVEGLCTTLALLLERAVQQQADGDAAMAEADAAAAAGAEVDPAWAVDLAGNLMDQAPLLLQASASAALLEHSLTAAKQQAWQPLPLLSVAFVTQQLEARTRGATAAAAEQLAAAYQELMQQCLQHLQRLGEQQAAQQAGQGKAGGGAAPAALLRIGTASCYRLLAALQQHMAPAAFVSAVVALAGGSPADRVRRKALQLLANSVRDAAAAAAWQHEAEPAAAEAALAEAALSVCQPVVVLVAAPANEPLTAGAEPVSALTKQMALAALGAVAGAFGAQRPEPLLGALPPVLAAVGSEQSAVRGSALATAAALAAALGPRLVPLLPKTVAAVIGAVQSAAAAVTQAGGKPSGAADGGGDSGSGSEGEDGNAVAARRPAEGPSEAAALELAAALAAVSALVEHLGAFLAPHLPLLLSVLLHPAVLQCTTARCSDVAAAIRRQLAGAVPPRLLLPPLLAHLEPATEGGGDAVCGLLRMLQSAVDAMDAAALTSHHEAVFAALLRALDLRRRRPAALLADSDGLDRCEAAAVACFVGLTMRLTEARFKPLFFRLLEWAHAVPAADSGLPTGTGQLLRSVALFSLVNALAEQLRGVFVPYFGLLLDACVAHLSDGSVAAAGKKGRKKKRKAAEEGAEGGAPTDDPLYVEHDWRLRMKVVRALHRCFLYDTGAGGAARFLDEARFQRLLPTLVAHLGMAPPPALAAVLEADGAADGAQDLEAALQLGGGEESGPTDGGPDTAALMDPFGRTVVACLAQMGVTAGSDAQWKPLNHQVLMMTRSLDARTRLLALEAAAQLAGRLSEEYLALLPETLPFLSELLEDAELAVEARCQRLVRQLEGLSGEPLAQYLS